MKTIPCTKMIKERNENFFLESNIFDSISKTKVVHFKKLWRSKSLDDDDKKVIWQWFDSFIFLSEKYQKSLIKTPIIESK